MLREGGGSRLEGGEQKPADPLAFAQEVAMDLEVQLSDFQRFREVLEVRLVVHEWPAIDSRMILTCLLTTLGPTASRLGSGA